MFWWRALLVVISGVVVDSTDVAKTPTAAPDYHISIHLSNPHSERKDFLHLYGAKNDIGRASDVCQQSGTAIN